MKHLFAALIACLFAISAFAAETLAPAQSSANGAGFVSGSASDASRTVVQKAKKKKKKKKSKKSKKKKRKHSQNAAPAEPAESAAPAQPVGQ